MGAQSGRGGGNPEPVDVAALEVETQRAISRARSVENIREALSGARALLAAGANGRLRLGALYSLGVARAYRVDLDCLTTRRIERDWCDAMAGTDFPVSREDIEIDRLKARRSLVLRPLARRHEALSIAARSPADLLPIVHDVCTDPLPEVDAKFCEMALLLALKRARELDRDCAETREIEAALEKARQSEAGSVAPVRPEMTARPSRRNRLAMGEAAPIGKRA
jgi:hypothetical protein